MIQSNVHMSKGFLFHGNLWVLKCCFYKSELKSFHCRGLMMIKHWRHAEVFLVLHYLFFVVFRFLSTHFFSFWSGLLCLSQHSSLKSSALVSIQYRTLSPVIAAIRVIAVPQIIAGTKGWNCYNGSCGEFNVMSIFHRSNSISITAESRLPRQSAAPGNRNAVLIH